MKKFNKCLVAFLMPLLFSECSSPGAKKDKPESEAIVLPSIEQATTAVGKADELEREFNKGLTVLVSESKEELKKYYEIPFIKEFYEYENMSYVDPRALLLPDSLSDLSYGDLRLLRNEVFARNGYLFSDGFLRGYFNRFKWYMPIFDVDTFKVVMSNEEQLLVKNLLKEEEKRRQNMFVDRNGISIYNADLVVNLKQFKSIDPKIVQDLYTNNFSIVNANRQMPFYVYDKNAYQYIPHYITTDLYLFILHKYFSCSLEKLDQNYMSKSLGKLLNGVINEIGKKAESQQNEALLWADAYARIARFALTGNKEVVTGRYSEVYTIETTKILNESGGPLFIENQEVNYGELKPRGHYNKSEELKKYFKSFKWISLNGINLNNMQELKGMIALGFIIKANPELYQIYKDYTTTIEKLAGQEDNVSIRDVIKSIEKSTTLNDALSEASISTIKNTLGTLNKERIKQVFGANYPTPEKNRIRIYFLSSTYSVSGEIFSKLVHINMNDSKRPFPKGLDIPAVFKNETAQSIILNEYKDGEKWPEYESRLSGLQDQFSQFTGWDSNYGLRGLKTALAATAEQDSYPGFMKTDAYNRKELSTMLSSWTHIKHDLILYQEKPYAAEAGQGGGPEPPKHYSYVEPNMEFWDESLKLAQWFKTFSRFDNTFSDELERILDIGYDLKNVAKKQQSGEKLSEQDHRELSYIGGRIEYTLLGLLESDHLPEREKSMALIADVYSYNGINLNVAVGHADDIYVLVPINNEYQIARGAVFSYYEFQDENIYTDEEWRSKSNLPDRPKWIAPLINNVSSPEGQMEYRYSGYGMHY